MDTPPANWESDIQASLEQRGLTRFMLSGIPTEPPEVVLRFGYCEQLVALQPLFARWAAKGSIFLNPPHFVLDSKVLLSLLQHPEVRTALSPAHRTILEECIPATLLLTKQHLHQLEAEQTDWILKFAGFDGGEAAWGGRSLIVGRSLTPAAWRAALHQNLAHPFPVVAQAYSESACFEVAYWDEQGEERVLVNGRSRLRSFFFRTPSGGSLACGNHVTFSPNTHQVSEGSRAVQAPIEFTQHMV